MLPNSEHQPFLGYTDENLSDGKPLQYQHEQRRPGIFRRRCGLSSLSTSHIVVCLVTSLAWIVVGIFLMPQQSACPAASTSSHSSHSMNHGSTASGHGSGMSQHGSASAHTGSGHGSGHASSPPMSGGASGLALGTEKNHNITSHARLITCGNSIAEAKQLGCRYDIMLNDWVPTECWDDQSIGEYMDDESWGAYRDDKLTELVPTIEEMSEMEFYWTSQKDHINHCAMLWRKQFNALYYESPTFDEVIADPMHTEHCTQYFIDMAARIKEWVTEPVRTEPGWAGCWIRDSPHDTW